MIEIPGYRHGSAQPVFTTWITIRDDISLNYQVVDDFLSHGFLVNDLPFHQTEDRMTAICDRVSFLANSLLQAIKIPVFEQAKIIEVQYNKEQKFHRVRLLVPTIANIPQKIVQHAHSFASKLLGELHPQYDFDAAFEAINTDFVNEFKVFISGGRSTLSIPHAARKNRIPFLHLGSGIYQLGWGSQARRFDRSTSDRDTALGRTMSGDKRLTSKILLQAGFPVPRHIPVASLEAAQKAGQELGYPVVLKPALLGRGEGVTIDIFSDDDLRDAYLKTQEGFDNLIVEKQITGLCYRIFVAGGKVRHVVGRHPMHVLGDGVHTVRELAKIENETQKRLAKHRRRPKLEINETSQKLFTQFNLDADSVPKKGLRVPFQRIESSELGGIAEDFSQIAHPDNIALAEDLAAFCGLDVVGVDLLSDDVLKAWHENGAKINEINFSPTVSPYREWVQGGLNAYIQETFPQKGRIPIHLFSGGEDALRKARDLQAKLLEKGQPHFLCTRHMTLKPDGVQLVDDLGNGLFFRAHALLLNKAVEGIIVVVQDESILITGFPFDCVSNKVMVNDQFVSKNRGTPLSPDMKERIIKTVEQLPIFDGIASPSIM